MEKKAQTTLGKTLLQSLHGSTYDYTQGPLGTAILLLAVPMVLEMLMESVFVVVDVFFVGKLGPTAVATVGLTESLLTIIYTLAMGLSIGATALVARRTGEKDLEGASQAAAQSLLLGFLVSLIIAIVGLVFTKELMGIMGAAPEILNEGLGYTKVMLGGNLVIILLFLVNALFRGAGDGAIAMRTLFIANLCNIILGPCLIFGIGPIPALGVTGAGIATTIGRGIGATYALFRLFHKEGHIEVSYRHFKWDFPLMHKILNLSASGTFQIFIGSASWIGIIRILSSFGSNVVAGYTIGMRVVLFALLPCFGIGNAAATMVGQCLGAKNPERAEQAVWRTGFYNFCFMGGIGLIYVLFAKTIVGIFTQDPEVLEYGVICLRTMAYGFLVYPYGMVLSQSFNGAGDTLTPTYLNLIAFWAIELPLAYFLAIPLGLGPQGAFWAIPGAFTVLTTLSIWIFRKGRWKNKLV